MASNEEFRFQSHAHLVELDAATNQLMMLVVAGELAGNRWNQTLARQSAAYSSWVNVVAGVQIDPMPALDGRPAESLTPSSD